MSVWMIRAGRGGIYAASWLNESRIGISWDFNGKDINSMNREQIRAAWTSTHPDDSKNKVASSVGQVYRFAHDMERGQTIIIYDPSSRLYHIGTINGDCVPTSDEDEITYTRAVIWNESAAPRDALKQSSKNSLGGIQTVFTVSDDVLKDLQDAASGTTAPAEPTGDDEENNSHDDEEIRAATYDNGIELIKDRVNQLDWEDMERLVAGLLKAMGYCARITPKGPDGGRDVIASPDALGLESPRIVVEVKHRKGAMGASAIRSFIGGLRTNDRGLYVSTGGFTREARYEADRSNVPMRLLDLDGFVRHYVDVYDKTDEETRDILPLTRIWWPA